MTARESEQIGKLIGTVEGMNKSVQDLWHKMDGVEQSMTRTTILIDQHEKRLSTIEGYAKRAIMAGIGLLVAGHAGGAGLVKLIDVLSK